MDRKDYSFKQRVTEAELDGGFNNCEAADQNFAIDAGFVGVFNGLGVTEAPVPNLTTRVATGVAYDSRGQRCRVGTEQEIDCSQDFQGIPTAVVTPGNQKWISIFLGFDRLLSDPRTDGNGDTVYFERGESFSIWVKQGAEAIFGYAERPALDSDAVLLADILLSYEQVTLQNADINTSRRQDQIRVAGTPTSIARGRVKEAIADLTAAINAVIVGTTTLAASSIDYDGGAAWADGSTNPATDVESQLDKIISDLSATTAASGGAAKIGIGTSGMVWADGLGLTGGTLRATIGNIVGTLAAKVSGSGGTRKIGAEVWDDGDGFFSLPEGTLRGQTAHIADWIDRHVSQDPANGTGLHPNRIVLYTGFTTPTKNSVIGNFSDIQNSFTDTGISVTANGLKVGDCIDLHAVFGIGATPTGAYTLRLNAARTGGGGGAIDGTETDAEVTHNFVLHGYYEIPQDGDYTFTVQYANPSQAGAAMTILGEVTFTILAIRPGAEA